MKKYEDIRNIALSCGWDEDGHNRYTISDKIINQMFIINVEMMSFCTLTEQAENVRDIFTISELKTLLKVFGKQPRKI